jgi:hypothetical protein
VRLHAHNSVRRAGYPPLPIEWASIMRFVLPYLNRFLRGENSYFELIKIMSIEGKTLSIEVIA